MKKFLALSLSYVVFIMLINVKMPTIEHEKSFITSRPVIKKCSGKESEQKPHVTLRTWRQTIHNDFPIQLIYSEDFK